MPNPVATSGEVVVDIVAASVDGADWKVREGKSNRLSRFPYIPGRDFSGVVSVVGEGVRDLRIGDEVFGVCDVGQEGAYAEKIAINAAIAAKKTDRPSHVDAAALALAGLTAICAIVSAGEKFLQDEKFLQESCDPLQTTRPPSCQFRMDISGAGSRFLRLQKPLVEFEVF
jgi:NADPH:quinone reductase-like Zn-dependent oxidoreductase